MKEKLRCLGMRSLSVVLAVLTVLYVLPLSVMADAWRQDMGASSVAGTEGTLSYDREVTELTERREENVKHFRRKDGSVAAVAYPEALHYRGADGSWQDIDHRMTDAGNEYVSGDQRVRFAKKIAGNETIFFLKDGEYHIQVGLSGAKKKSTAQVSSGSEAGENIPFSAWLHLENLYAGILFADILDNTDIRYTVASRNIKEDIIVKAPGGTYTYHFLLKLENLCAQAAPDGSIHLHDKKTGAVRYRFATGYMRDAAGAVSYALRYTLADGGNGKYTLTVEADRAWMEAPERQYPVCIDPPLAAVSTADTVDTGITKGSPNTAFATAETVSVSDTARMYWRAAVLPTLPAGAYLTDAVFSVYLSGVPQEGVSVGVRQVLSAWGSDLTWNRTPDAGGTEGKTGVSEDRRFLFRGGTVSFHVLSTVRAWYDGANYGLALTGDDTTAVTVATGKHTMASHRPSLVVTYRDMKGMEDYWSYTSQNLGLAGSGHVNLASGQPVFSLPLLSGMTGVLPYTAALTYHGAMAGKTHTGGVARVAHRTSPAPLGFLLNCRATLTELSLPTADGGSATRLVFSDGDGTEHYFSPVDQLGNYLDEDGLRLLLHVDRIRKVCTLTDADGNQYTFEKTAATVPGTTAGYSLTSMQDTRKNTLTFTFDTAGNVTAVAVRPYGQTGSITQMHLSYTEEGQLFAVWDEHSGRGAVLRCSESPGGAISATGGGYLREVVFAHAASPTQATWQTFFRQNTNVSQGTVTVDAVASYTYDAAGRLLTAHNGKTGYMVRYTYTDGRVTRITESSGGTAGQEITLSYAASYTRLRSSGNDDVIDTDDDLLTTYTFDTAGRNIGSYTTDVGGTRLYGASGTRYAEKTGSENKIKTRAETVARTGNYVLDGNFRGNSGAWSVSGNASVANGKGSIPLSASLGSLYQVVALPAGEYTLAVRLSIHHASGATVELKATSLSHTQHRYTETVPVNAGYASGTSTLAELRFSSSPTDSASSENFRIAIEASGGTASGALVEIESVMLSRTEGASDYNLVSAGHFEDTVDGEAKRYFTIVEGEGATLISDGGRKYRSALHGLTLMMRGTGKQVPCYAEQTVYTANQWMLDNYGHYYDETEPRVFTVSGWALGSEQSANEDALFEIRLILVYYNLAGQEETVTHTLPFNKYLTDWQYVCAGFATDPEKGMVKSATLRLCYSGHAGDVMFDDLCVTEDSAETASYTYDTYGRVQSCRQGKNTTWYYYADLINGKLLYTLAGDGTVYEYGYNEFDQIQTVKYRRYTAGPITQYTYRGARESSELQSTTTYNYDETTRLLTSVSTVGTDGTCTVTSYRYDTTGSSPLYGTLREETASDGSYTLYFYDRQNGFLLASVQSDGNGTAYTYDSIGNLTGAYPITFSPQTGGGYVRDPSCAAEVSYTYDAAMRLSGIAVGGVSYTFAYDNFGNPEGVSVAGHGALVSYTYGARNGKLETLTYENGLTVRYTYDALDRVSEIGYRTGGRDATAYRYTYDAAGRLSYVEDVAEERFTRYQYHASGQIARVVSGSTATGENETGVSYTYDAFSRMSSASLSLDYPTPAGVRRDSIGNFFAYTATGEVACTSFWGEGMSGRSTPTYDRIGRITGRVLDVRTDSGSYYGKTTYTYEKYNQNDTLRVSRTESTVGTAAAGATVRNVQQYTYDKCGNITEIRDAGGTVQYRYAYDHLGQLVREDNRPLGVTLVYTYDGRGNLLGRKEYAFTTGTVLGSPRKNRENTYAATGWRDLLVGYDGKSVTYDAIGNPVKITEPGGTEWREYTWQGRRLLCVTQCIKTASGSVEREVLASYRYNADGIRISKEAGNVLTEYLLRDGSIVGEKLDTGEILLYLRDETGAVVGLKYRTDSDAEGVYQCYFFEKNLQGDIVAMYDDAGKWLGGYTYDAWGNCVTTVSADASTQERNMVTSYNLFRYRGYYWDYETGYYYLESRYYDPEIGRWISPEPNVYGGGFDEDAGLIGYNVYVYCANNPVNNFDPTGEFVISTAVLIGIGIGALIGGVASGAYGYNKAVKSNVPEGQRWKCVVGYGLGGAVIGGVIGGFVGYGIGVALGAKASSGLVVKSVSKALSSVSRNTMHHIMQSKHAWGRVLRNATWNNVKGLINTTMKKGATTLINKQGGALIYEAVRNNVVVRYAIIDGVIKISDAWVKTR